MRNLKKFLALVLAMLMVMSASAAVSADFTDVASSDYKDAINDLAVKGIIQGMTETTFGPKQPVNREQMAIFMARVLTGDVDPENTAWKKEAVTPFEDLGSFQYQGAIQYAWANGVINGKSATEYAPGDGIKYVEALAMAIRALGLDDGKIEWPWGYFNTAVNLGLTDGIEGVSIEQALTREETAQIIYNLIWCDVNGETLASKNFNQKTADNSNLFVITSTPKQNHGNNTIKDYTANDKGITYVGVQALIDGIANGTMYYIPAEDLGIAAAEVEDYFFYSVELINFDAENGTFGAYIMGDTPKVVTNSSVTVSGNTLKVDNVTYTAIQTTTLSDLKNNIAVYDLNDLDEYTAKLLTVTEKYKDTAGAEVEILYLVDVDGNKVARKITVGSDTKPWYYELATGATLSEEQAVAKYGVGVGNGLVAAGELGDAYQLSLYDDDRDGLYERAVYTKIYMGIYDVVNNKDILLSKLFNTEVATGWTYTDANAKVDGAISVYTVNEQLKTVNVIEILEPVVGTLEKYTASNKFKSVTVTVDGTTLPMYWAGNPNWATLGAKIISRNENGRNPFAANFNLAHNDKYAALDYYKTAVGTGDDALQTLVSRFDTGATVMYYAYNGYILMISKLDRGILDDIAIVETPREFYYDGVYYDIVTGGEHVESAHITILDGKDISGYKTYDWLFAGLLNNSEYHNPGSVYFTRYGVNKGDHYEFGIFLDDYEDFIADYYGDGPIFKDATLLANGDKLFFDAKGECADDNDSTNWLRTDAETVWYFIYTDDANPMNTKVQIQTGAAYNAYIQFDGDTWIFADKYKAAADLIIVKDCVKAGIDFKYDGSIVGYLKGNLTVETGTAEDFGLVDKTGDYKGTYYKYPNAKIFDFNTGVWVTMDLFSKNPINISSSSSYDCFYYVSADGMIIATAGDVNTVLAAEGAPTIVESTSGKYLTKKYNIQNVKSSAGIAYNDCMAFINGEADQNIYYVGNGTLEQLAPVPATEEPVSLEGKKDIFDLGLDTVVVDAYFDNNGRLIATINMGGGNYMEITAEDDVTDLAICGYDMADVATGEEALRILNGAHKVSFIDFDEVDDDAEIFVNHTAVFWLDYYSIGSALNGMYEQ